MGGCAQTFTLISADSLGGGEATFTVNHTKPYHAGLNTTKTAPARNPQNMAFDNLKRDSVTKLIFYGYMADIWQR